MSDWKARLANHAAWSLLESVGLTGLSVVSLVVLSWQLSHAEFGIAGTALAMTQMLMVIVERSFHDVIVQREALSDVDVDTAFSTTLVLAVMGSAILWWVVPWFLHRDGSHDVELIQVTRIMGLSLLLAAPGAVLTALHRRHMAFKALAQRSLGARFVAAIAGIVLALGGAGVWSLVAQQLLLVGLSTCSLWWLTHIRRPRLHWRLDALKGMAPMAIQTTFDQFFWIATPRTFNVLIDQQLGHASSGIFTLASRVVDMLRDVLGMAISQLALPVMSRLQREGDSLQAAFQKAQGLTTVMTFPLFAGLALCAHPFVALLFGERWLPAAPVISVLASLTLLHFSRIFSGPAQVAKGHTLWPPLNSCVQLAVMCALFGLLGPQSLQAAMACWVARAFLALPLDMTFLRLATGMSFWSQWKSAVPAAICTGVATTLSWSGGHWMAGSLSSPWAELSVLGLAFGLSYPVLMWMLARPQALSLIRFARQSLHRAAG